MTTAPTNALTPLSRVTQFASRASSHSAPSPIGHDERCRNEAPYHRAARVGGRRSATTAPSFGRANRMPEAEHTERDRGEQRHPGARPEAVQSADAVHVSDDRR